MLIRVALKPTFFGADMLTRAAFGTRPRASRAGHLLAGNEGNDLLVKSGHNSYYTSNLLWRGIS